MDIVHLLPDSVANQIAAGEVVQRPSSVVKELIENSIDAGATKISVILKDAGRSVIQVIDNGKGMSPKDCETAFARHATSKISHATDLFAINTFGFRGEALPSIASVAQVELRSRQEGSELGTLFSIAASEPQGSEEITMPVGTNIRVRDLFYNVPARRKFLKSESTELRNITQEFIRAALSHPDIEFRLTNNDKELYILPATILRKRIINIFGKNIDSKLLAIECNTEMLSISGFICTPNHAKKSHGEQYFFTNGRFMRHPLFHKAVMEAYSGIIATDALPSYFLYFKVNPESIDVNIHPTKTEIKFQHEWDCFTLIKAGIKEVLGKFNIVDSIDFDREGDLGYIAPSPTQKAGTYTPTIKTSGGYNPFNKYSSIKPAFGDFNDTPTHKNNDVQGWEKLFEGMNEDSNVVKEQEIAFEKPEEPQEHPILWAKNHDKYIVASLRHGLAIIDKRAAHIRILYDKYRMALDSRLTNRQRVMFPEIINLTTEEAIIMDEIAPQLESLGFTCTKEEGNLYKIETIPADFAENNAVSAIMELIESYQEGAANIESVAQKGREHIALTMAQTTAINSNDPLSDSECESLVYSLLNCDESTYSPNGKRIIVQLNITNLIENLTTQQSLD